MYMPPRLLVLSLLTSIFVPKFCMSDSWYISNKGLDADNCGTKRIPCKSLEYAIDKSSSNDSIFILASRTDDRFEICQHGGLTVRKSLHIKGLQFIPLLTCSRNIYAFSVVGNLTNHVSLNVSDITFLHVPIPKRVCKPGDNGLFLIVNADINITNCLLEDFCTGVELRYYANSVYHAAIESSEFLHVSFVVYSARIRKGKININAANIVGTEQTLSNGSSYAVSLTTFETISFNISGSVVRQTDECISINIRQGVYRINITSSILAENVGQGIVATFNKGVKTDLSSFLVEKVQFLRNVGQFASAINMFSTSKFLNAYVTVDHCQFYQNEAETFFGTVYIDGVHLTINNSLFINNVAGKVHGSIQGFGGAVYVEAKTEAKVFNTRFINNTCSGFGGTIFSRGDFHCTNCSFVGPSDIIVRPLLGDILYATAGLRLLNTTWVSTVMPELPKPFIWHPGSPTVEHWKIIVDGSFKATCPAGHNMTSSGVQRKGFNSSARISVMCNPCPVNEYSLRSGSLSFIHRYSNITDLKENIVQCYHCKYGGVCVKGYIRARANYYGFKTGPRNDEVHFVSCPVGYCCTGSACRKFNSCQANRRGELCGRCKPAYSENVINSNCIETRQCNDTWFWWIYIPSGFLYILSFMYLDKISEFVKHQLIWWRDKTYLRNDLREYDIIGDREIDIVTGEMNADSAISPVAYDSERDTEEKSLPYRRSSSHDPNITPQRGLDQPDRGYEESDRGYHVTKEPTTTKEDASMNEDIFNRTAKGVRKPDIFSDILHISFYFFQMFILLRMRESIVLTRILMGLKSFYSSLFTLSIEGHNSFLVCPIPKLHAIGKMLLVKSFTLYVLCLLVIFHACVNIIQHWLKHQHEKQKVVIVFSVRLKVATIQIILIGYATLTTTTLTLLNCVPVNRKSVLLLDGTVKCYTWWQYVIIVFFILWVVPFPFVMVYSLVNLKRERIGYRSFILAWTCPMLYVLYVMCAMMVQRTWRNYDVTYFNYFSYFTKELKKKRELNDDPVGSPVNEETISIREILFRLESPFKGDSNHLHEGGLNEHKKSGKLHEPAFWQGAMIGRRLLLILVMTFINAPVSRLYCALFLCIVYLIHQVYHRPYMNEGANLFEIMTSAILIIFCSMNLFFAYSYVSDITPEASDEHLTFIFRMFEAVVLVFVPSIAVVVLLGLVVTRCTTLLFICVRSCYERTFVREFFIENTKN